MTKTAIALSLGLILLCSSVAAQTPVYLPATGTYESFISGCTTATPTVCTVDHATGLTVIDPASGTNTVVGVFGVAATGVTNHMADPRGLLRIKAISGNNVTLMTMAGADQPFTGTWESGANATTGEIAAPQRLRKMTAYTAPAGPKGVLDGWTGPLTRSWATGTHNGLNTTNGIVVSGNVATVTFDYDITTLNINVVSGIKMSVWGTTNSTLSGTNGSEFTITVVSTGTTSTLTFPVTLANGNYTHNDVCGPTPGNENVIGGTSNCVRVSFRATSTNSFWTSVQSFTSSPSTLNFQGTGSNMSQYIAFCSLRVFVDQKAQGHLDYVLKHLKTPEQFGGNNWPVNPNVVDGGNYPLSAQVSQQYADLAAYGFAMVGEFLTTTQLTKLKAALLNDIQDPTPCNLVIPAPIAVITGTTTAADSTHITITGGSGTNDFYKDNVVDALTSTQHSAGVITAYDGTTKIATLSTPYLCSGTPCGWDSGQVPSNTATFSIWESFKAASSTQLANVVLTGKNTHWLTTLHVGDYIFGLVRWTGFLGPQEYGGLVGTVTDDTHATIFTNSTNGVSTTPVAGWITPPFQNTDCGGQAVQAFWTGAIGSQPVQYPTRGGNSWKVMDNIGGNLASYEIPKNLALVDVDPRAVTNLAKFATLGLDENLDSTTNYQAGNWSGSNYGPGRAQGGQYQIAASLSTIPGFPSLDLSGGWVNTYMQWMMYGQYPDIIGYPRFGDSAGQRPRPQDLRMAYGIFFNPLSTTSQYLNYFFKNVRVLNTGGSVSNTDLQNMALRLDPNAPTLDYKTQPLQYFMTQTSRATSLALGGRTYPVNFKGADIISRNSWTFPCSTHIWINGQAYAGDHGGQNVQPDYQISHCGILKGSDDMPPENQPLTGPWVEFDGTGHFKTGSPIADPAILDIDRWSGPVPYGDVNSQYMCGRRVDAGAYTTVQTRNNWSFCHFKPLGGLTDDIFIHFRDVVTPSSHIIRGQDYFTLNGQTTQFYTTYPEGTTSYPGSGGCGSLNTNRVVLSQQDGGTSAPLSGGAGDSMLPGVSPGPRTANLVTTYLPIGTINVNCDGSSFSGALGNSERVSIYGGSTVGGTSTSLQYFTADAILDQPATTVSATTLSGGAGWAVAQVSNSVMAVSSDGTDHNAAAFTTTCSGNCQVVVMDLVPGTYAVKVGGTPVSGSPMSVPANDNSLHFFGAAGAVTVDLQGVAAGGTPGYSKTVVH